MAQRVSVPTPADFDAILAANLPTALCTLGFFTGAKEGGSNSSWCPDCVKAEPIIDSVLDDAAAVPAGTVVLVAPCARAEYRGNPGYPYRQHAKIKLKGVPTLIKWSKGGNVLGALVESQCWDAELVKELVNA